MFRNRNQENIAAIMEPEGLTETNRRSDLVVTGFQNNRKPALLDFTHNSYQPLATNNIVGSW